MVLPVGASLMPIPSAPPINAAQSSAEAMRSSRIETVTSDDVSERSFSVLVDVNWVNDGSFVKINTPPALMEAWDRAMVGGNPEGKTLRDLTLILEALFLVASRRYGFNEFLLANDHGQIIFEFKLGGRFKTYVPVPNVPYPPVVSNHYGIKKEKYARINDELTLSVLRTLYNESVVNNFLAVKNDYFPVLLVR